jgi:hypothetical protein
MFCESCNVEIPPAWKRMIIKNECPACGEHIMSQESKELLDELKNAMERMPNDPEGLAGWLLSNYRLAKVGDAEPTGFHGKPEVKPEATRDDNIPAGLKVADNPIKNFLDRTDAGKTLENRKSLKEIVAEIKQNEDLPYGTGEQVDVEDAAVPDVPVPDVPVPDDSQHMAKTVLGNNSVMIRDKGLNPLSPDEVEEVKSVAAQLNAGDDIHPALQEDRMKRLQAQHALAAGGGKGSFRRG